MGYIGDGVILGTIFGLYWGLYLGYIGDYIGVILGIMEIKRKLLGHTLHAVAMCQVDLCNAQSLSLCMKF